jgi:Solute carrier family 35
LQVPVVLRLGGAAVLNLSLLSSDLWAAAARVAFFGEHTAYIVHVWSCCHLQDTHSTVIGAGGFSGTSAWVFFGSLGTVAAGIVMFSAAGEVNAAPAPATGLTHAGDAEADGDDFSEQSINGSRNMDALERGGELTRLWAGPDSQQAS